MKIIINAEPDDMEYAMGLVMKAKETFDRHPSKIGWGWSFGELGKTPFFIRRITDGLSASPAKRPK